jgi:hypothetical protein
MHASRFPNETDLMSRLLPFVLVPALVLAGPVRADVIAIALEGATFNPDSDTLTVTPRTFTLDLAPGVPFTTRLQPAAFTVSGSMFATATFDGTLSRGVTAVGSTGVLSQPVNLSITPTLDTLTILPGPITLLDLDGLRRLEIAPLGTTVLGNAETTFAVDLLGTFRLIVIPEPSTLVLSGLGPFGLLAYPWRRRSQICPVEKEPDL